VLLGGVVVPGFGDVGLDAGGMVPGVVVPGFVVPGLSVPGVLSGVGLLGVLSGVGLVGAVSGAGLVGVVSGVGLVGVVSGTVPGAGVAVPGVGFAVPGVGLAVPGVGDAVPGVPVVLPGVVWPEGVLWPGAEPAVCRDAITTPLFFQRAVGPGVVDDGLLHCSATLVALVTLNCLVVPDVADAPALLPASVEPEAAVPAVPSWPVT